MKILNPHKHYELILKAKKNSAYFYVDAFKEAKKQLTEDEFSKLQTKLKQAS